MSRCGCWSTCRPIVARGTWRATVVCLTSCGWSWWAGVLLVSFAFLFGVVSPQSQAAIVGALAVPVSMLLFVAGDMRHPFRGSLWVKPEGLELVLQQFSSLDGPNREQLGHHPMP